MDLKRPFHHLKRAVRYLVRPANLLYLGISVLAINLLIFYGYKDNDDLTIRILLAQTGSDLPPPNFALWIGYLVVQYLCLCKLFDGMARLADGRDNEPVPFAPVTVTTAWLPCKYNIGLLLLGLALLPVALPFIYSKYPLAREIAEYLLTFAIWLFAAAALMNLVGENSIFSMINPGDWIATIRRTGIGNYALIILVQAALFFAADFLLQNTVPHMAPRVAIIFTNLVNAASFSLVFLYPACYIPPRQTEDTITRQAA